MATKFYSSQLDTHKLTHDPIASDSYRYYNFAILRSSGMNMVLDTMRYDQAFFCRKSDVENIIESLDGKPRFAIKPFNILLGRFDWRGKTKPNWTPERLMTGMEFEYIDDPLKLYELKSEIDLWQIKPLVKFKSVIEVTGTPAYILRTMHLNRAYIENENDARKVERGFHQAEKALVVKLQTFFDQEREWIFPKESK